MNEVDRVAQAIMRWAVPVGEWDDQMEETRERWRSAARAAISAMDK